MQPKQLQDSETNEVMSSTKVSVSFLGEPGGEPNLLGSVKVVEGKIVVEASTPEDEQYVYDLMRDSWRTQFGIPTIIKKDGKIAYRPDGRVEFSGYANFHNSSPDDVLEAFVEYTNLLGVLRAEQQPL